MYAQVLQRMLYPNKVRGVKRLAPLLCEAVRRAEQYFDIPQLHYFGASLCPSAFHDVLRLLLDIRVRSVLSCLPRYEQMSAAL